MCTYLTHLLFSLKVSKLLHEGVFRREACRFQKVKQAEELFHCILERSTCQQDLVFLEEDKILNVK